MTRPRALASPASLKGVLPAPAAAAALAEGFRHAGVECDELAVADGGDGTAEVLGAALGGEWREAVVSDALGRAVSARYVILPDGTAVVESAEAIGLGRLATDELDPLRATSRGLGELIVSALGERPASLIVGLGGSATVDGGAGMREILGSLPVPTRVAFDVRNPLLGPRGAARAFAAQKGASPDIVERLERSLASMPHLQPFGSLRGAGAAGGLGAAFASMGAELVPGADLVLSLLRLAEHARGVDLVVTGEGTVDRSSAEGKATGEVVRTCRANGVRCVVFGGRTIESLEGAEHYALSGNHGRAREDLVALGERLGLALLGGA